MPLVHVMCCAVCSFSYQNCVMLYSFVLMTHWTCAEVHHEKEAQICAHAHTIYWATVILRIPLNMLFTIRNVFLPLNYILTTCQDVV